MAVARATFMVLTSLSKCPPDQGARGVCFRHVIRRAANKSYISGSCWRSWRNRSVARKERWLSERMTLGVPWVAVSLCRHIRNDVAVSDVTVSRYTALVTVQTKRQTYTFCLSPHLLGVHGSVLCDPLPHTQRGRATGFSPWAGGGGAGRARACRFVRRQM